MSTFIIQVGNTFQPLMHSIDTHNFSLFIDFINNNKYVQSNILENVSQIFDNELYLTQLKTINGRKIPLSSLLSQDFDVNVINRLDSTFQKAILNKIGGVQPDVSPKVEQLSRIPVYSYAIKKRSIQGGSIESFLQQSAILIVIIFILAIVFMNYDIEIESFFRRTGVRLPLVNINRLTVQDLSLDERRSVYRVLDGGNATLFVMKISGNTEYIQDYEHESRIYERFNQIKADSRSGDRVQYVVDYYGGGYTVATSPSVNNLQVNIQYTVNGVTRQTDITMANDNNLITHFATNNRFYYLLTHFDNNFRSWHDVYDDVILTNINIANWIQTTYQTITISLGEYNSRYGFYHGDLHTGNILVNEAGDECRFFDFDFSGFLCGYKNSPAIPSPKFATYTEGYYRSAPSDQLDSIKIYWDNFANNILKNCNQDSKNFMFLFDSLRLYVFILIDVEEKVKGIKISFNDIMYNGIKQVFLANSYGASVTRASNPLYFQARGLLDILRLITKTMGCYTQPDNVKDLENCVRRYLNRKLNYKFIKPKATEFRASQDWINTFFMSPDVINTIYTEMKDNPYKYWINRY